MEVGVWIEPVGGLAGGATPTPGVVAELAPENGDSPAKAIAAEFDVNVFAEPLNEIFNLTIPEISEVLKITTTTADSDWAYARAWLHTELRK